MPDNGKQTAQLAWFDPGEGCLAEQGDAEHGGHRLVNRGLGGLVYPEVRTDWCSAGAVELDEVLALTGPLEQLSLEMFVPGGNALDGTAEPGGVAGD